MKNILFLLLLSFSSFVYSQKTGSITGTITDFITGEPLLGATINVDELNIQATADINGVYLLKNLQPGIYSVSTFFWLGYKSVNIDSVVVEADAVTKLNIRLSPGIEDFCTRPISFSYSDHVRLFSSISDLIKFYEAEEFRKMFENACENVIHEPLSMIPTDVDVAAYSNARKIIFYNNELPFKDAIRTEEFINYFDYRYEPPTNNDPSKINIEFSDCIWDTTKKLIKIGIQAKQIDTSEIKPSNLVFLIDMYNSMYDTKKLPLLKKSLKLLIDNLKRQDKISIVVYGGSAKGLVLPPTSGDDKSAIYKALDRLYLGGSTTDGEGIKLAYEIAKNNLIKDGNNRIILATDGNFNFGLSCHAEFVRYVQSQKNQGVSLTMLAFCMDECKEQLQDLSRKCNAELYNINDILEAKKVLVNQINATFDTVARDVKIQVEFNPARIEAYRLIGYENRFLYNKDFTEVKKKFAEIGNGHNVTALYEVVLNKSAEKISRDYKYQSLMVKEKAYDSDEVCNVKISYKDPESDKNKEINEVLKGSPVAFSKSSIDFQFASAVAGFAIILRRMDFPGSDDCKKIIEIAQAAIGKDINGYRKEFIDLVKSASFLLDRKKPRNL